MSLIKKYDDMPPGLNTLTECVVDCLFHVHKELGPVYQSQIYAYLKGTGLPLGFLVNFNVPLIRDGISRYTNRNSETPKLRVEKKSLS